MTERCGGGARTSPGGVKWKDQATHLLQRSDANMQMGDRHWGTVRVMTDEEMEMCEDGRQNDNGWLLGVLYTLGAFALGVWIIWILLEIY